MKLFVSILRKLFNNNNIHLYIMKEYSSESLIKYFYIFIFALYRKEVFNSLLIN